MENAKFVHLPQHMRGEIHLHGSKSYTNRALILAALAEGTSILYNYSPSDDSALLIRALQCMGISTTHHKNALHIAGQLKPYHGEINVGMAGTTLRFLIPLCCIAGGEIILAGTPRLHQRPIGDLVNAMRDLGANIDYLETTGCAPIVIRGFTNPTAKEIVVDNTMSSQFISALLLCGCAFPHGLQLKVCGKKISQSYILMTLEYLKKFAVEVHESNQRGYTIKPQKSNATEVYIEGDATGATYFWGLAAISGGSIRVHNVSPTSEQGDIYFATLLEQMGCQVHHGENWIEVKSNGNLRGINCDMTLLPDSAQTLSVVAAFAKGKTHISGLSTLKHKETDRCKAVHDELKTIGIHSEFDDDSLTIYGGTPQGKKHIHTYDDHRMAMSFSMLGCLEEGVYIENPQVVAKSFPDFWEKLSSLQQN
ncbi:3-phosphoshikimate 1-carboxyvinyltransferase [Candidatus Uabimicrobium amorphum]|uniref:3-phosphoshikimate 1-carboxyvinyltransferase n=2 Tax=Uabimicrobium amorphum TaxID=2596890 RepID=A0A5S9F3S0_UABAM|nr:3-phosphoshikimate 1-carboxyvinyltransferase [Candidatus Uabimicrobium amorphum]